MTSEHDATCLRYSVVLPVYNEAGNIRAMCRHLRDGLPLGYEVLVCYDFEEDSTLPALAALPAEEKPERIRLVRNHLGPGVRYAIEAGLRAAAAPVVIVMMADLSDDLTAVEPMLRLAEDGAAVACGSRYMRGGQQIGGPWLKQSLSRLAGVSLYWMADLPTHDCTNSFKAYRRDFLETVQIESTAGFCLAMEITVKAHFSGRRVAEVPSTWRDRSEGQSRFRLWKWLPHYLYWYFWALRRQWQPKAPDLHGTPA